MSENFSELLDGQGSWKEALVRTIFLPIDADAVLKIKPSRRLDAYILAWQPEKNGIFTVRSAYHLAFNASPEQCNFPATSVCPDGNTSCWKSIWGAEVPPKVKTFAFKDASDGLATEANKRSRGIKVAGQCLICGLEQETLDHALYKCPHARQLWTVMRAIWEVPSDVELQRSTSAWFLSII
jgi:hypothetical protein